jgi:glyoxylase-like metal-dependent hydrolase (beta-lactamase superfamily II)
MAGWFTTSAIDERTWAIDDHGSDTVYLITGNERALLLDTGWGVGDLPALVASLTTLPLVVVNSHGHPDHTYGNGDFQEVHIASADVQFVSEVPSLKTRRWIGSTILPRPLPPGFDVNTWASSVPASLVPIRDGQIYDLGGRTLEVIALPGHSPGSICVLDRRARYLFTGDSVLAGTIWLHLRESLPLTAFRDNLRRLQGFSGAFDHVLPAHGDIQALPLPAAILDDLLAGVDSILAGECVGREATTFAGDGLQCDFGTCSILYKPVASQDRQPIAVWNQSLSVPVRVYP